MSQAILTVYNRHAAACGIPPALSNESAEISVGYFANRHGEQWLFTFDRATRTAILRGGDGGWGRVHAVHDGRVDELILAPEETAWIEACWRAAATLPVTTYLKARAGARAPRQQVPRAPATPTQPQ